MLESILYAIYLVLVFKTVPHEHRLVWAIVPLAACVAIFLLKTALGRARR